MKKFDLFMACLGNGVSVCNSAVEENGDYKKIAHIAECGKVKWYINPHTFPVDALESIERTAADNRKEWENRLSQIGERHAYYSLLDKVPHADFMHIVRDMKESSIEERIEYLKSAYIKAV